MAGLRGNTAWLMAQKQTAKGTAAVVASANAHKVPFSGGSISPIRETDQLAETDATRDQGVSYAASGGVEGSPEFYVRDASIGFWLWAALGTDAVTGTTPNYVHTLTPANTLPYITTWRNIADTLWEQYRDCKVGTLTIGADAGAPLTATAAIQGLAATRLTADPSVSPAVLLANGPVYNYNNATVTLSGGVTALVSSFELTIENAVSRQQTDDFVPYDVVEGTRAVTLSFDLIFETLNEYNSFHYGGAAGTTQASTLYTTSAIFDFSLGANNAVTFNLPSIAYDEFPVEPDPGGGPITASVRATAQRPVSGAIATATVKNQVASY